MRKFSSQREVEKLTVDIGSQIDFRHATERGLGLRVSYGGTKTYYVAHRFEGRQRRHTIGHHPHTSLEQARRLARAVLADADKGVDPAAEKLKQRRHGKSQIFRDVVDDYIERHAKPRKRSWRETKRTLDRYFIPDWGKLSIRASTREWCAM
jgi:hypothetical protein